MLLTPLLNTTVLSEREVAGWRRFSPWQDVLAGSVISTNLFPINSAQDGFLPAEGLGTQPKASIWPWDITLQQIFLVRGKKPTQ